jgi:PAS domain S-box-containing protein
MRIVVFAAEAERAEALAVVLRAEGYEPELQLSQSPGWDPPSSRSCPLVFVDLALGLDAIRTLCEEVTGARTVMPPLFALVGELTEAQVDPLIAAGMNIYLGDDLGSLAYRIRFLRSAIVGRSQFARILGELHASEERYRTVISAMEQGLIVRRVDGSAMTVNESARRILGMTAEEVAAGPLSGVAHDLDGAPVSADQMPSQVVLRTGIPVPAREFSIHKRDGTVVRVSTGAYPIRDTVTGELVAAVATITDVTARRRAEHEFRTLLERAPEPVVAIRDGKTLWANAKWAELLGYDNPGVMAGIPLGRYLRPQEIAGVESRIRGRLEGADVGPIEQALVRRDGTEVQVTIVGVPTLFEDRPLTVAFARDLTEQRRIEAQLMSADRLASLGRLAASVGHEINNPLTYVIGNLQLAALRIRRGEISNEELLELLDEALEGADRVRRIAEDLRVFAKQQHETHATTDVRSVLESCIRMTGGEVRYRARLVLDIEDVPRVRATEARIAQVLSNLLFNAAQAIPEGQADHNTITVSVKLAAPGVVEIRVADTGIGITAANLPHVFEPFFTTRPDHGGTGLGLSVCHMLVTSQGGQLEIASEPGKGTCVSVRLLVATEPVIAPTRPAPARMFTPLRVLVVDDEIPIAEFLRDNLAPHRVTLASSGREAISRIDDGTAFDVIVCDLMMPDVGGIDVHEHVRRSHPGLEHRIVFITGGAFTPRAAEFLADVKNMCVHKPFQLEDLLLAIERAAATPPDPPPLGT